MPAYAMCQRKCPKNETCYRFRAIPDEEWQVYANFSRLCCEENSYQMYMKVRPYDEIRPMEEIPVLCEEEINEALKQMDEKLEEKEVE